MMAKRPAKPAAKAKPKAAASLRDTDAALERPVVPVPRSFSEIRGQDRALGVLKNTIATGRIHHAWIFHGPQGVGKFTTALAFAALILDPETGSGPGGLVEPPHASQVQALIRSGTHPDLHIIVKELAKFHPDPQVRDKKLASIPVDVLRHFVVDPAKLAPALRNDARASKVFIIDEAELLNGSSQNVLLKTLEEPPDRTVLILVTSSEEILLPTIRSRAQRVPFFELAPADMNRWYNALTLSREISPSERDWLFRFAAGSPGMLLRAVEDSLFEWHEALAPSLSRVLNGEPAPELGGKMHGLMETWAKARVKGDALASKEVANHTAAHWMIRYIGEEIRTLLRARARGTEAPMLAAADALDRLRLAESHLHSNVGAALVFDSMLADIAAIFAGEAAGAN